MTRIVHKAFAGLLRSDEGATAIEYGLIAALIAGVLTVALSAVGVSLNDRLAQVNTGVAASQARASGGGGGGAPTPTPTPTPAPGPGKPTKAPNPNKGKGNNNGNGNGA